ncbi:MAG: 2-isopropylmalate synthase [Leptospirales bacterium]
MKGFDFSRYSPFPPIHKPDRRWPDRVIMNAPVWASVDLRDGNQALPSPMDITKKLRLFNLLVRMGFKEIEIGFPSASQLEHDFVRRLIEEDLVPEEVTIQVLTQAREDLITRSYEALKGAKRAIMHVYNSTNPAQRTQVFRLDRKGVKDIAVKGARLVKNMAAFYPETDWTFQYSPESFSDTEPDFALEVCSGVSEEWQPEKGQKVIFNLPATVEMSTPNVFADQVEWFCDHLPGREHITISVHTHNDRGCAVAAAELAVMAGADRVEGTLFGNGERTGNMDILTMAMNLYSRGVDPKLDLSCSQDILSLYTGCTGMPVHPRHPWFGEMVYTAFSGSHQDAIRKGISHDRKSGEKWTVPYLPIDPQDLGRNYDEVVRINSQSGKGGVAHVLERDYSISLPKWLAQEFGKVAQAESERTGDEVDPARILALFQANYLNPPHEWKLDSYQLGSNGNTVTLVVVIGTDSQERRGEGHGAVEALMNVLSHNMGIKAEVEHFNEHALSIGTESKAIAYVRLRSPDGMTAGAAGLGEDTTEAALQAVLSAAARIAAHQGT